jgi:uncharacterized protein
LPIIFPPTAPETHASTKINCADGLGNSVIPLESERMLIEEISEKECRDVLTNATVARLGCSLDNQPYVVPVVMTYEADYIYFFSTLGKKIKWMRANPRVCVQVDSISGQSEWVSVIANGEYQELEEPRHSDERNHARKLLEKRHNWWLNALAERRTQQRDQDIQPVFFRVKIASVTGLRGVLEET